MRYAKKIEDKDKTGKILVKKHFVIHEEVIDVFHEKNCIPTIEQFHVTYPMYELWVQWKLR